MADPVPLTAAARALGLSARQVQRDIARGAPLLRRGRRGRGGAALIDLRAYAAWRASRGGLQASSDDLLRLFAVEIPEIVADAADRTFREIEGAHKRPCGRELAGMWYRATVALLDRARRDVPDLPDVRAVPELIDRLSRI